MKLFLSTVAVAALLSTGAFAQSTQPDESKAAPSGQTKATKQDNTTGMSGASKASSGGAMKSQTTGSGDLKKDDAGSKDNPGKKTGVSGGSSN
jgi:hypothetical protein